MLENLNFQNFAIALLLTLIAGLSSGIGSLLIFSSKPKNNRMLSWALGLSAGVMIYLSFMEMLPESIETLKEHFKGNIGGWLGLASFFAGILFIAIIDRLIPEGKNPHSFKAHSHTDTPTTPENNHLQRQGILLALAIAIHNFPEGMAMFVSALDSIEIALPIIVAISIHNIPEGMAISAPIYHATGKKSKALLYSMLSGLAEPAGALIGGLLLLPFWTEKLTGFLVAAIAGIMVYISFDELLPSSHSTGHHHTAVSGVIAGMAIMAISLMIL